MTFDPRHWEHSGTFHPDSGVRGEVLRIYDELDAKREKGRFQGMSPKDLFLYAMHRWYVGAGGREKRKEDKSR